MQLITSRTLSRPPQGTGSRRRRASGIATGLRSDGHSLRAIAEVVKVSPATVHADLAGVQDRTPVAARSRPTAATGRLRARSGRPRY